MKTAQAKIQKFGSLLSAMVMPNIGVFIGWGLLTALFIDRMDTKCLFKQTGFTNFNVLITLLDRIYRRI